ncbi:MAG: hypothetical protein Rhirs2KO_18450 [Rhizobiaceae bacterium]
MAKVIKPFTTTLRRFREGMTVSEEDDLAPHTFDGLVAACRIEETVEPKTEKTTQAQPARSFRRKSR